MAIPEDIEPLFQVAATCMCCKNEFRTSRVRPSFKKSTGTDTDFYVYYKAVNPDYYVVRVCPVCGFSATENFTDKLTDAQRAGFMERVRGLWSPRDYGGERSWEDALKTYQLALLCAQAKEESARLIAGLLHHIAWLYREKGDTPKERRFLEHALDAYVNVYETESGSVNNARLMYLIGELNRRLGRYSEGVRWFSRVINDKKVMDSAMIRASREQWKQTREDMLAEKLELPDELKQELK